LAGGILGPFTGLFLQARVSPSPADKVYMDSLSPSPRTRGPSRRAQPRWPVPSRPMRSPPLPQALRERYEERRQPKSSLSSTVFLTLYGQPPPRAFLGTRVFFLFLVRNPAHRQMALPTFLPPMPGEPASLLLPLKEGVCRSLGHSFLSPTSARALPVSFSVDKEI